MTETPPAANNTCVNLGASLKDIDVMRSALRKLGASALDLLFPVQCIGCGKDGDALCEACACDLPRVVSPHCPACWYPDSVGLCGWCKTSPIAVDGIRAPFLYVRDGLIQKALLDLKFHNMRALAPQLGQMLADFIEAVPLRGEVVVPVPSHPRRLRERGFNQAALIAREFGKSVGMPVDEKLLARVKDAKSQLQMTSRAERRSNVAGNFACTRNAEAMAILLVDDLATTGGTMSACAEALKSAGASEVWGLVVARAP